MTVMTEQTGSESRLYSTEIHDLAAQYACNAYAHRTLFTSRFCAFDHFWLAGELFGFVKYQGDRAFVVFRGTDNARNPGNWLFANLQPYRLTFDVVDPQIETLAGEAPPRRLQGASRVALLAGGVHQGYFRAFSWLWYGSDAYRELTPSGGFSRTLFAYSPAVVAGAVWGATVGWAVFSLQIALGRGLMESLFRRSGNQDTEGQPLAADREHLARCREVYFVGHSLGGAIAALSFAAYRAWCSSRGVDNAFLITFGAPPLGDTELMDAFENAHHGRYRNLVHVGDPVTQLPPRLSTALQGLRYCTSGGIWGLILGLFVPLLGYPLWRVYSFLYGMEGESIAPLPGRHEFGGSDRAFTIDHHFAYFKQRWKSWSQTPP